MGNFTLHSWVPYAKIKFVMETRSKGVRNMARRCIVCDRGSVSGNQRSHAENKTRRTWKPNLQKTRIVVKGSPRRAYVCTQCLKSGKVERAL